MRQNILNYDGKSNNWKDFYTYKPENRGLHHLTKLFEIVNDPAQTATSLRKLNKIFGEIGTATIESSKKITQFINYCQHKAAKENKTNVKITREEWVGIGHQNWKIFSKLFVKLPGNLEWGRKGFWLSLVMDRSPSWRHDWNFNCVHFRDEYKMKIPLSHPMALRILNTIYWLMSKINSLKKSMLDTWKIWIQIWWITLIAPHFLQRLREIIGEYINKIEKKIHKKQGRK